MGVVGSAVCTPPLSPGEAGPGPPVALEHYGAEGCASLVPQSHWRVSNPAGGQQPTLPPKGLPPRQRVFVSLGPGVRLGDPEPPVLNVPATQLPERAAPRAPQAPLATAPGWSPAPRELTTELQTLLLSIWTWWTELKDFHVSLDISGLRPAAGAEDG